MTNGEFELSHCKTEHMAADIFTKAFVCPRKWTAALRLINHVRPHPDQGKPGQGGKAVPAALPPSDVGARKRTLVEFCCSEQSMLGQLCEHEFPDCKCIRITENDDATSAGGMAKARSGNTRAPALLWGSLPCTGGSLWQNINSRKPGGMVRLRRHWKLCKGYGPTSKCLPASFATVGIT